MPYLKSIKKLVTRLRVTKSPDRDGSLVALHKRRGVDGAKCGVR